MTVTMNTAFLKTMSASFVLALALALQPAAARGDGAAADAARPRKSGETKTITLPGGATMEMVWCAPGEFEMGSPASEHGRFNDESQRTVTISKGFWIGKYEVTQEQWKSVMRSNPSRFKGEGFPVENVSWHDCALFVKKVNAKLGGVARLPTEAEWEYACRAGATGPVSGGDKLLEVAWYDMNSDNQTHHVGSREANGWGIYDMQGNVLEWCADWYSVSQSQNVDPKGPPAGSFKVLRGGCWFFYERDCRCAYRIKREPNLRNCIFGLRLVCSENNED